MTLRHAAGLGIALRACVARAAPGRSFAALMRAIYPRIEAELACVDAWAPRGGTAVDVGAWYGPWTARMSRLADLVVTIEPNPALARLLRAGFPAARVIEAAASDEEGTARLWLPPGGRGAEGVASLECVRERSVMVRRLTIDGLGLSDVRFVKMDVEGHEAAALRGAEQTIRRDSPLLLVEAETRYQPDREAHRLARRVGLSGQRADRGILGSAGQLRPDRAPACERARGRARPARAAGQAR